MERLRSSLRKFYGRYRDIIEQYELPLSRIFHDILDDNRLQWHPALHQFWPYNWSGPYYRIWLYVGVGAFVTGLSQISSLFSFYLIARVFHRTFTTGAACQQRTLTPLDTWFYPNLGLASVLMMRPISLELVFFPDVWVSNIPRYFCLYFVVHVKDAQYIKCWNIFYLWQCPAANNTFISYTFWHAEEHIKMLIIDLTLIFSIWISTIIWISIGR